MKILKFYNVPTYSFVKKENWLSIDKDFESGTRKTILSLKKQHVTQKSHIKVMILELDRNSII